MKSWPLKVWFARLTAGQTMPSSRIILFGACAFITGAFVGRTVAPEPPDREKIISELARDSGTFESQLATERRWRTLGEKTMTALTRQVRELNEDLLEQERQLSFFRQLLDEREGGESPVEIRSLVIVPDFRENYHRLESVLVHADRQSGNFRGRYELVVSLSGTGAQRVLRVPDPDSPASSIEFRFYHEINHSFSVPAGTEIKNAELLVYDRTGELMATQLLVDRAPEPYQVRRPSPPTNWSNSKGGTKEWHFIRN